MELKKGDIIKVKDNLKEVLIELGFEKSTAEEMGNLYAGTTQTIYSLWVDDDGQAYATIDLCIEIPAQCCEQMALQEG